MCKEPDYAADLLRFFAGDVAMAEAKRVINQYFYDEPFTGQWFERFADIENPNMITAGDIAAVSMLSVTVPPRGVIWLLSLPGKQQVSDLLCQVPTDLDIWDSSDDIHNSGPLYELWWLIHQGCWPELNPKNGMGITTISKLLAAKRPRLVPVIDSVVIKTLKWDNYWKGYRKALSLSSVRTTIEAATASAPINVSLLRRADVVLWMINKDKFN